MSLLKGKVINWNHEKGFGFIRVDGEKDDIFAHITAFKNGGKKIKAGDLVKFKIEIKKGRKRAKSASVINKVNRGTIGSKLFCFFILAILGFLLYSFVIAPKLHPAYKEMGFSCLGKTHCSSMTSCDEAKYYLDYCPNVQIDGDGDGVPCEKQLCKRSLFSL